MANYEIALNNTLQWEDSTLSGEVTHDTGGTTRFGISEKAHPDVYPEMATCSRDRALEIAASTLEEYWVYQGLTSQEVANKLFDMSVNLGLHKTIGMAQQCAQGISDPMLIVDGLWGPQTEAAINAAPPEEMLACLRDTHHAHYENLATTNPDKYGQYWGTEEDPGGWRKRAKA